MPEAESTSITEEQVFPSCAESEKTFRAKKAELAQKWVHEAEEWSDPYEQQVASAGKALTGRFEDVPKTESGKPTGPLAAGDKVTREEVSAVRERPPKSEPAGPPSGFEHGVQLVYGMALVFVAILVARMRGVHPGVTILIAWLIFHFTSPFVSLVLWTIFGK